MKDEMLEKRDGYQAWINSGFRPSTEENFKLGYNLFIRFMNETVGGNWDDKRLIREREGDLRRRTFVFEQKVVEFFEWMKGLVQEDRVVKVQRKKYRTKPYTIKIKGGKKLSDNTRATYTHGVRSFFSFHRLDLRLTRQQQRILSREPRPVVKYYDFTLEDIKRMARVAKPQERYVLLVGRSIGFRGGDFVLLKQGTFMAHLDEEPPCSLGEIFTEKEGAYAKPFLDFDAKDAAQTWLMILKAKGNYGPDKTMIEIEEEALTDILKKLVKRAGIETGGQQIRFHSLRVFLTTRLSKVLEENRWKQIVGKKVPERAYVKPFEIREDFAKVLPLIAVSTRPFQREEMEKIVEKRVKEETEALKTELQTLKTMVSVLLGPGASIEHVRELAERKRKIAEELEKHGLTKRV